LKNNETRFVVDFFYYKAGFSVANLFEHLLRFGERCEAYEGLEKEKSPVFYHRTYGTSYIIELCQKFK
jgi:hypothetical protein